MSHPAPNNLGSYDFRTALSLPVKDRLAHCIEQVHDMHRRNGYAKLCDLPPVATCGAAEDELSALERELGLPLPDEYRAFLAGWRYLDIGTGLTIWGLGHEGVSIGKPWVSSDHPVPGRYLLIGDYWRFADGDQLMIRLDTTATPVVIYRHEEHPPAVESFAPTFSLALWRIVHEVT